MKHIRASVSAYITLALVSFGCLGANCNGRQVAKTVLDVAELSCVLFHDEIEDEKTLAKACGIAEDLIPEVRKIVFARKSAASKKAAAKASAAPSVSASK